MKCLSLTLAMVVAAICGTATADTPEDAELRIVFIAYQNPEQIVEDVEPVVAYLEEALGVPVKHFVATNYAGVVEALRNGTADVGFMGPLQYVIARKHAGAVPLLGEVYQGKPYYHSRIFVRKDSGIASLADLKGKTIAFTDPISSSGYLYPVDIFRKAGLFDAKPDDFFRRVYFAGGDEQAIRAVHNGFVDAAGISEFSYNLLRVEERDDIISIAESDPLPSHCVVVRKGLPEARRTKLKNALLALNDGENKKLLKLLYGVDGYVEVTHDDFKQVEEKAIDFGILE